MPSHEHYMKTCLELARKGAGKVSPNPMVGAVLVYKDKIIGQGYHEQYGGPHAEVNCIRSVANEDQSLIPLSTLYVSLEPCDHYGKTPPCSQLIVSQKIARVVVACRDLSDKVNGKGIQTLLNAGIEVTEAVLEQEAIELNKRFFTFHREQRPYIILKWAESVEGFIGRIGERVHLSGPDTNTLVHQWRSEEDAIWVGYQTVLNDDPQLNVRHVEGKNPVRMVYDRAAELPAHLNLFDQQQTTLVYNHQRAEDDDEIHFIPIDTSNPLQHILQDAFQRQILSVIVEGGSKLLRELIRNGLWDEIRRINTPYSLPMGVQAPGLPANAIPMQQQHMKDDVIHYFRRG